MGVSDFMDLNDCQCGIDETGRGPVIGPLVISLVCGSVSRFREIGVRDSKKISPVSRKRMFHEIREIAAVEVTIIDSLTLNREMKSSTLNVIELNAAKELLSKASCPVFVDAFDVDEKRLTGILQQECGFPVVAEHKADVNYPAVSAASIISKVTRDSIIEELSKEYGHMGSGYPSDPETIRFLRENVARGKDLSRIVRTEWETWKKLMAEHSQDRLF